MIEEEEDGGFDIMEAVNMEIHASADLVDICDGEFSGAAADSKIRQAVDLARGAANGDHDRIAWLDRLESSFLDANSLEAEQRGECMADLRKIVSESFHGFNVVETYELKEETKH